MSGSVYAANNIGTIAVQQLQCTSLTLHMEISNNWEPSPNPNTSVYKVYRITGFQGSQLLASSDNSTIQLNNLQPSTQYHFVVQARSRHAGGWGIPLYRDVNDVTTYTPACPPPPTPAPGDVRLRHEATGKCIFGNPVDGGIVHTWTCWQDPGMAVALETQGLPAGQVRIRMRAQGKCLYGNPVNGKEVKNFTCWSDQNMLYIMEPVDSGNPNRIRLKHLNTGQCMYAGSVEGNAVKNFPCWNDPGMVWVKDPF
jgi:hypothetical protein